MLVEVDEVAIRRTKNMNFIRLVQINRHLLDVMDDKTLSTESLISRLRFVETITVGVFAFLHLGLLNLDTTLFLIARRGNDNKLPEN